MLIAVMHGCNPDPNPSHLMLVASYCSRLVVMGATKFNRLRIELLIQDRSVKQHPIRYNNFDSKSFMTKVYLAVIVVGLSLIIMSAMFLLNSECCYGLGIWLIVLGALNVTAGSLLSFKPSKNDKISTPALSKELAA